MNTAGRRHACGWTAVAVAFAAVLVGVAPVVAAAERYVNYPVVSPGQPLEFPRDHGSHSDYRTEWWYLTGWLQSASGEELGFQVTFFRVRPDVPQDNPSAFAPRQLVIAHAALSDPQLGRLRHAQRIARAGLGLAGAAAGDADVRLDGWFLSRQGGSYRTGVLGDDFSFELAMEPTQPVMANGVAGYSQKGPDASSASYYYSVPQLRVQGRLVRDGAQAEVQGLAWLDHEWSTALLDAEATGWDWIGINLGDGGALMAFRMRDRNGAPLWSGASLRRPNGVVETFGPGEVEFTPGRRWRSPRTSIEYPVTWRVRAGPVEVELEPLLDDQESDSRATTGAVYWEGAVRALENSSAVGRGYLELTGYGEPIQLPGDDSGR